MCSRAKHKEYHKYLDILESKKQNSRSKSPKYNSNTSCYNLGSKQFNIASSEKCLKESGSVTNNRLYRKKDTRPASMATILFDEKVPLRVSSSYKNLYFSAPEDESGKAKECHSCNQAECVCFEDDYDEVDDVSSHICTSKYSNHSMSKANPVLPINESCNLSKKSHNNNNSNNNNNQQIRREKRSKKEESLTKSCNLGYFRPDSRCLNDSKEGLNVPPKMPRRPINMKIPVSLLQKFGIDVNKYYKNFENEVCNGSEQTKSNHNTPVYSSANKKSVKKNNENNNIYESQNYLGSYNFSKAYNHYKDYSNIKDMADEKPFTNSGINYDKKAERNKEGEKCLEKENDHRGENIKKTDFKYQEVIEIV